MFQANSPYHRSVQDLAAYSSPASRLQSQYQSLFLNNPAATAAAASSRLHAAAATVKSEVPWSGAGDYHSPSGDFSHHLDRNYSPHPYPNMPTSGTIKHHNPQARESQVLILQGVQHNYLSRL